MPKRSRILVIEFFARDKQVGMLTIMGKTLKATGAGWDFKQYAIEWWEKVTPEGHFVVEQVSANAWESNRHLVEEELKKLGATMHESWRTRPQTWKKAMVEE